MSAKVATSSFDYRIVVVDDDPSIRELFQNKLHAQGHNVKAVASIRELLALLQINDYHLIILDILLNDNSSLDDLEIIRTEFPNTQVVVLTGYGTKKLAVKALSDGAVGFLSKSAPLDHNLKLVNLYLRESTSRSQFEAGLTKTVATAGDSALSKNLRSQTRSIRNVDTPVTIIGPYGVGKESLARFIHDQSYRSQNAFLSVNCSNFSEGLLDIELFGSPHSGTPTLSQTGRLEMTLGGTLLLEEIHSLSLNLQKKLLSYFQKIESKSPAEQPRLIATSFEDLRSLVKTGDFLKELFEFISVVQIELPPLKERLKDVGEMAKIILADANRRLKKSVRAPKKNVVHQMMKYSWPGNIRELKTAIDRAVVLTPNFQSLSAEDLLPHSLSRLARSTHLNKKHVGIGDLPVNYSQARDLFEKTYLKRLLGMSEGNVAEASRLAGANRSFLYRMIDKHKATINNAKGGPENE